MHWHINGTHYLEQWGDARAFDGTASIVQPLIAPLYGGKSEHELLSAVQPAIRTARATKWCAATGERKFPERRRLRSVVAQGA